mgnify:CR=1 FL=1
MIQKQRSIEPHDLARKVALLAEDKKAADIIVLDVAAKSGSDEKSPVARVGADNCQNLNVRIGCRWLSLGQVSSRRGYVDDFPVSPRLAVVAAVGLDATELAKSDDEAFLAVAEFFSGQAHEVGGWSGAIPRLNKQLAAVAIGSSKHDWHAFGNRPQASRPRPSKPGSGQ